MKLPAVRPLWRRIEENVLDRRYRIVPPHCIPTRDEALFGAQWLFVSDNRRVLHVDIDNDSTRRIRSFYHPMAPYFLGVVQEEGVAGMFPTNSTMQLYRQGLVRPLFSETGPLENSNFLPEPLSYAGPHSEIPKPREDISFADCEAYALYNWELFFHIPLLVATRLYSEQRFDEAMTWFHYIFDPLSPDLSDEHAWQRPWRMGRFFDHADARKGIEELMMLLAGRGVSGADEADNARRWAGIPWFRHRAVWEKADREARLSRVKEEIERWRRDPFKPHLLARMRITPYMKKVVMKYLDNLIAWGDQLFRRDSIESINEATQLYILAAEILGPRPLELPEREHIDDSYAGLAEHHLDELSNALEDELPEDAPSSPINSMIGSAASAMLESWHIGGGGAFVAAPTDLTTPAAGTEPGKKPIDQTSAVHARDVIPERRDLLPGMRGAKRVGNDHGELTNLSRMQVSGGATRPQPASDTGNYGIAGGGDISVAGPTALAQPGIAPSWEGPQFDFGATPMTLPAPGLFFCIPQNEVLVDYWDRIADRLFKIRHCMNIEGMVRELPLFEPPIEPGLLVKAAAAGVDFSTVLNDMGAPGPRYRFSVLAQMASDLCQEVRSLGNSLLGALETRDAEALARLRSQKEIQLMELVRDVRQAQVREARESLASLREARALAERRLSHLAARIEAKMIPEELSEVQGRSEAASLEKDASSSEDSAQAWSYVPNITIGYSTGTGSCPSSWSVSTAIGGMYGVLWHEHSAAEKRWDAAARVRHAEQASIAANYKRREEDWRLQALMAEGESAQIAKQIAAAEVREEITNRELANHQAQTENAKAVDEYLRTKFTNEDLYDWMIGQISTVYFQSYQLAYDMAKRAERAYRFELGVDDSDFIRFGYWDGLRKGLRAGEALSFDLKRMESAYLENNRRDYEITRHISLRLHDPLSLMELKETGKCEVRLPEELFDADYPGHYFRRIKSVGVSIPCVVGPYTSINCTLTLLSSRIRTESISAGSSHNQDGYREREEGDDPRFRYDHAAVESIATSHGKNDSGLFELSFRDERYLPFEGAGAISHWRIELPKETNAFDLETVSDLVLTLRYTAREGGAVLRRDALASRRALLAEIEEMDPRPRRMFDIRHEFPDEWASLVNGSPDGERRLELALTAERFSYLFRGSTIHIKAVSLLAKLTSADDVPAVPPKMTVAGNQDELEWEPPPFAADPSVKQALIDLSGSSSIPTTIGLDVSTESDLAVLQGLYLLVTYKVTD
jgi:hypothetical protein